MNNRLLELFKQKQLLKKERNKDIKSALKSFLLGVIAFCFVSVFRLVRRKILLKSKEFSQELFSILPWITLSLFFLTIFIIFFCYRKFFLYQKKLDEIEQQIIEELGK